MILQIRAAFAAVTLSALGSFGCLRTESSGGQGSVQIAAADEQRYCAGMTSEQVDGDPFATPQLIERVGDLTEGDQHGKLSVDHLRGARVVVRPTRGMSAAYLDRVLRCHEARVRMGAGPDRERDPLAVNYPAVAVAEEDARFVIAIRAHTTEDAQEIVRRAKALAARQ